MAQQSTQIVPFEQKLKQYRQSVSDLKPELLKALPQHMNVDRLVRMVWTALQTTPSLVECTPRSFLHAVMECAQAGLEPTPGQAYIVPFKDKSLPPGWKRAVFIPDYRGLIGLSRRSGFVDDVFAEVVYDVDEFDVRRGTEPMLKHIPQYDKHLWDNLEEEKKHIVGFYAVGFMKDTSKPHFEYLPKRLVDRTMRRSPGRGESGPWTTDYVPMGKKTAVKQLMKFMPLSSEDHRLQIAIARDTARDAGETVTDPNIITAIATVVPEEGPGEEDGQQTTTPSKLDQMAAQVEQEQQGKPQAEEGPAGDEDPTLEGDIPHQDHPAHGDEDLPALPTFQPHQQELYDALMTEAGGDEQRALSLMEVASIIKPGGHEQHLRTWNDLAEKGSVTWVKQTLRKLKA